MRCAGARREKVNARPWGLWMERESNWGRATAKRHVYLKTAGARVDM